MTDDLHLPISPGTGWLREELQLEANEQPHHFEIARKLRDPHAAPIPQVVRDHIADLLDGTVNKLQGAQPPSQPEFGLKVWVSYVLRQRHAELMDQIESEGEDRRYRRALADLQDELTEIGIVFKREGGTLEEWMNWARKNDPILGNLYRRRKKKPVPKTG